KMQVIDMKMSDVELDRALEDILQHDVMVSQMVPTTLVQTQRPRARSHQPRVGLRISARKEHHFVALSHQFLGEVARTPSRTAVMSRTHAFIKPRHLCKSHT